MTGAELVSAASIKAVWCALGGAPLRHGRGRAFWRDGDGYNVSLNNEKGAWHDFATGEGGGILDLIQRVQGGTRKAAAEWLADTLGTQLSGQIPAAGRRRARFDASAIALDIEHWRVGLQAELETAKRDALAAEDWVTLEAAASQLHGIQNGTAGEVVAEFSTMRTANPKRVKQLIQAGRDDWAHAGRVCGFIVALLADAQTEAEYVAA
ncbi:hypothetical protein [uncultured Paludibaculum sp.]|uniref:hypothetical protein n=1 Tax=uncultured Paludibaculum sp. TaxID=1765020 RepID=UPI002AAC1D1D|nr:hypothetical protein [uncultured Paludibaculum sp.]